MCNSSLIKQLDQPCRLSATALIKWHPFHQACSAHLLLRIAGKYCNLAQILSVLNGCFSDLSLLAIICRGCNWSRRAHRTSQRDTGKPGSVSCVSQRRVPRILDLAPTTIFVGVRKATIDWTCSERQSDSWVLRQT